MTSGPPRNAAPIWDNIPPELAQRQQWLLWRFEVKRGQVKPLKVPYWAAGTRRSGMQGSDADRAALVTLEQARLAYEAGRYSGVGFAFLPGDGLIGIDIDGAIDAETGEVSQRLQSIIAAVASYTEYSPSGKGAHIIARGETTTNKSNEIGLEIFAGRQYFTFTGAHWPGSPRTVEAITEQALRRLNITVNDAKAKRKQAPGAVAAHAGAAELRTRVVGAARGLRRLRIRAVECLERAGRQVQGRRRFAVALAILHLQPGARGCRGRHLCSRPRCRMESAATGCRRRH